MKFKTYLAILLPLLAIATVALADRIDVWDATSVNVYHVELNKLPDGGCSVLAHASYSKGDGGTVTEGSQTTEVGGANRTICLDILNNKAPVLFKNDKGL